MAYSPVHICFYKKDDTFEIKFTRHVSVAQRPFEVTFEFIM